MAFFSRLARSSSTLPSSAQSPLLASSMPCLTSLRSTVHHTAVRGFAAHRANKQNKSAVVGTRGSRGHGWYQKYRAGLGGRHLQGRWNIDSDDMRGWNDAVFKTSGEVSENKGAYFELEYTEGTDPASFKVGRIELEVAAGLLPLTTANFLKRIADVAATSVGVVEKVEKGVGVVFSTEDCLTEDKFRLVAKETNEERNATEYNRMQRLHDVYQEGGEKLAFGSDSIEKFRDGEAHVLSFAPEYVVAMLRETKDGTSSTKFMITTQDGGAKHLQGTGVVFGRVTKGMEVLDRLKGEFTMRGVLSKRVDVVGGGVL